jgi:hypothetical protein
MRAAKPWATPLIFLVVDLLLAPVIILLVGLLLWAHDLRTNWAALRATWRSR